MNKISLHHARSVRLTPLAACLAIAIAAGSTGNALAAGMQAQIAPHSGTDRIILRHFAHHQDGSAKILHHTWTSHNTNSRRYTAMLQHAALHPPHPATAVTSCDDDGPGTLRDAVTNAAEGDIIDLSASGCSTITLLTGAVAATVDNLTIKGSGSSSLTIDGNANNSILFHFGAGTLTVQDITLTNGSYYGPYATGGAIYSTGNVTLTNVTVSNSEISGPNAIGGAVFAFGNVALTNSLISGNSAVSSKYDAYAGGVFGVTGLSITSSTISGNSAVGAPYDAEYPDYAGYGKGGGAMTTVSATISGSTLSTNTADYGGAIAMLVTSDGPPADPLLLTNSTISGNTANALGGGIFAGFPLKAQNSTIANNAGNGYGAGGLFLLDATELESTIVSNNTGAAVPPPLVNAVAAIYDPNIGGYGDTAIISGANNLIVSSDLATPTGTLTTDPNLQPLANNGGTTQTHALIAGSSALNVGNNLAGLSFDQRGAGFPRSSGAGPDIGAFELRVIVAAPVVPVPTLSTWALGLMVGLLGLLGWRRQKAR